MPAAERGTLTKVNDFSRGTLLIHTRSSPDDPGPDPPLPPIPRIGANKSFPPEAG